MKCGCIPLTGPYCSLHQKMIDGQHGKFNKGFSNIESRNRFERDFGMIEGWF